MREHALRRCTRCISMTVRIFFRMCDGQLPVLPVVNHKAKFFDPGLLDGRCTRVCPTFVRNFDSELADTSTACYFTTLSLVHVQSWTGPWDTPTPWDRAHFSLPQQQMFHFFELSTSIIVLSIFTESLIKLQAKVLELFEKECILGSKQFSRQFPTPLMHCRRYKSYI